MTSKDFRIYMRIGHRYLGYFMAGIMLIYALSGIVLVFRDTDFLKSSKTVQTVVAPQLDEKNLAKALKLKSVDINNRQGDMQYFKDGQYNAATGEVTYSQKKLPTLLEKMNNLHKAPSKGKLGVLNTLFGLCLLFFVVSSLFLFAPGSKIFRRSLAFLLAGAVVSVALLMI